MIPPRCISCGKKVVWAVLATNLCLFVLKMVFGIMGQSKALYTDALQSLANVIITVVVLVSLKIASRGADEKYPYGYGKIEFLASGIVNTALMVAAIIFTIASFRELMLYEPDNPPKLITIFAAGISIIANQIAFGYGRCAGEKLGSPAILANAMVSRADVGTSAAVIVAVVGSNLGFSRLDHIVSIMIGILIVKVTLDGTREAIKGLMDVSAHPEERHIRNLTEDVEGVQCVGDVKARFAGRGLWVDMNVFVPADWVLSRGLSTVRKIREALCGEMEIVSEVSVQLLPFAAADDHGNEMRCGFENAKRE